MLDMYLLVDGSPRLDVLIIDEAQDLSSLQWSCVEKLARYSKEIYVAGDDDQAIYTWAGADVQKFISLEGSKKVLNQSYRVPRKVHDIALGVVNRIKTRIPKVWKPRKEEGGVYFHNKVEHIDMKEGEWLILARNNYLLNHVEEYLKLSGKVYQKNNKPSVPDNLIEAIQNWEKLRKGEEVEAFKIKKLLTYFKADSGIKKGFKTLKGEDDETLLNMKELKLKFGLLTDKIWHESFELLGDKQREYMISCLRAGEKLVSSRIKLNTIHGSKGGEAENVVLLTDMANRSYEELYKNSDHECRAFYVGVTRTKNNLHIVKGKTRKEFVFL
jgi:superfamily I DNA/RNA helicase